MALIFSADIRPICQQQSAAEPQTDPAFVLVESCYVADHGWSYAQSTPQGRERLRAALSPFRQKDIPTVYWLTRDVIHYENFRACIADFDLVCVADPRAVDIVRRDYPDKQVIFLPPCVSPQMHNPFCWDNSETRILFDGWAELQERPERYDFLTAIPPDRIDIVESRYTLHKVKLHSLPAGLRERLRGCLTHAQFAWAARHYSVALEDSESFSSPLARHQKRLEFLSCGLKISSNWTPDSDLASLLPAGSPVQICDSAKEALTVALEMVDRHNSEVQSGPGFSFVKQLWRECGLPQRLAAIVSALGLQQPSPTRPLNAVFDGSNVDSSCQAAAMDIFRSWDVGSLFASNAIPAMRDVAGEFVGHPRHFGSFWEASGRTGIDTILISHEQRAREGWLQQLITIKDAARAEVAVLTAHSRDATDSPVTAYIDAEGLTNLKRLQPVAILATSEHLPRRPEMGDLKTVLAEICKSRKATVAMAEEAPPGQMATQ